LRFCLNRSAQITAINLRTLINLMDHTGFPTFTDEQPVLEHEFRFESMFSNIEINLNEHFMNPEQSGADGTSIRVMTPSRSDITTRERLSGDDQAVHSPNEQVGGQSHTGNQTSLGDNLTSDVDGTFQHEEGPTREFRLGRPPSSTRPKREPGWKRSNVVCDACRRDKTRCDGQKPTCQRCRTSLRKCTWTPKTPNNKAIARTITKDKVGPSSSSQA
jgi:ribosomal protein L37AE/L43A